MANPDFGLGEFTCVITAVNRCHLKVSSLRLSEAFACRKFIKRPVEECAIVHKERLLKGLCWGWLAFGNLRCRPIDVRGVVSLIANGLVLYSLANRVEILSTANLLKLFLVDTLIPWLLHSHPTRAYFVLLITTIISEVGNRRGRLIHEWNIGAACHKTLSGASYILLTQVDQRDFHRQIHDYI